ncbi:MAG: recombination regulator RecX [Lautropia sp.]|nr:recombination regulator RecX [Lautropia sp.]
MAAEGSRQPPGSLSLRGRALRFLARREHSRAELRRKLLTEEVDEAAVNILLDDLESKKLLSDRRFAEVLAQSKGARYGVASVSRTLAKQGVSPELAAAALAPLSATERERALAIWRRRFGAPPTDLKARARQHRFMLGRGFEPATVSWIIKQAEQSPGGDDC